MDRSAWRLSRAPRAVHSAGLLAAIPVGVAIFSTSSLISPPRRGVDRRASSPASWRSTRRRASAVVWQLLTAPVLGAFAAIGALTAEPAWLAVVTMIVLGSAGRNHGRGLAAARDRGHVCVLALLLAQGLGLSSNEAAYALILGAARSRAQVLVSVRVPLRPAGASPVHPIQGAREAWTTLRGEPHLQLAELPARAALGHGARGRGRVYHALDLGQHGYWVPLTVLFVPQARAWPDRGADRDASGRYALSASSSRRRWRWLIGGLPWWSRSRWCSPPALASRCSRSSTRCSRRRSPLRRDPRPRDGAVRLAGGRPEGPRHPDRSRCRGRRVLGLEQQAARGAHRDAAAYLKRVDDLARRALAAPHRPPCSPGRCRRSARRRSDRPPLGCRSTPPNRVI